MCSTRQSHQPFHVSMKNLGNLSKSLELQKMMVALPSLNVSVKTKQKTRATVLKIRKESTKRQKLQC